MDSVYLRLTQRGSGRPIKMNSKCVSRLVPSEAGTNVYVNSDKDVYEVYEQLNDIQRHMDRTVPVGISGNGDDDWERYLERWAYEQAEVRELMTIRPHARNGIPKGFMKKLSLIIDKKMEEARKDKESKDAKGRQNVLKG